jgi:hypothetical protein
MAYEIKLKKERTSEQCPEFVKKNPKRPILRGKIVLMTLFTKIALCAISTLNEDPGLSRLFWGVVVFRRHVILSINIFYELIQYYTL